MRNNQPRKTLQLQQQRVMVIDDNSFLRSLVVSLLYALGFRDVVECSDGGEALEELRIRPADIIFLDWAMDPINGIEFLQLLRRSQDSPCPRANVIMLTGHTTASHVIEARNAGVTEFLAKPVSAQKLYSRVMSVLQHPRPFVVSDSYVGPSWDGRAPGGPDESSEAVESRGCELEEFTVD